ncbi:hypothetical protein LYSHEL_14840 [Lysobacter helvus]|uniref:ATP-binding protein n=1 Tax=Lysobacter helvus TaxID=2675059 RepID=A0ABN6G0X8_9GAMM|nr:hypothetical protein LYSHEL_14840 [Lysobacter helvus]
MVADLEGTEQLRSMEAQIYDELEARSLAQVIFHFAAARVKAKGESVKVRDELSRLLDPVGGHDVDKYLITKILDLPSPEYDAIAPTLNFEANSSVIDHYETLLKSLVWLCAIDSFVELAGFALRQSLDVLYKRTRDQRIVPLLRAVGVVVASSVSSESRARVLELFFKSDYSAVSEAAVRHLNSDPLDMIALAVLAKSDVRAGTSTELGYPILDRAKASLIEVFKLSEKAYASAADIIAMSLQFYSHDWALQVRQIAVDCLREETATVTVPSLRRVFLMDVRPSPLARIGARGKSSDALRNEFKELYGWTGNAMDALLLGVASEGGLSPNRRLTYLARHSLAANDATSAESALMQVAIKSREIQSRVSSLQALAAEQLGDLERATKAAVDAYLANDSVPSVIPVGKLVDRLEEPSTWPQSIDLPILFGIHNTLYPGAKLSHLRFAFENFQEDNSIKIASDLSELQPPIGKDREIAYLRHVWLPEVMRQTTIYRSSAQIEEARIQVCRYLASIDAENAADYNGEIKDRVKRQEIAKGTTLVEQSKVYVDIEAIKTTLRARLGGAYARFRSLERPSPSPADRFIADLGESLEEISLSSKRSVGDLLSSIHIMSDESNAEVDAQFDSLYTDITNEFVKGDHGLNAYLSTRVRHGRLSNALRKPVADEHLVSTKKESGEGYYPNSYWEDKLDGLNATEREAVLGALDQFTRTYDSIIGHIRNDLVQVRVMHGTARGEKSEALLVYRSSNTERMFLRHQLRQLDNIDDFIDVCIDTLWAKTDQNLLRVQQTLESSVKDQFADAFDRLSHSLDGVPQVQGVLELRNAILRANTASQLKLHEVSGWFKRSTVYYREDYFPSFAVEVASNITKKTLPEHAGVPDVDVQCESFGQVMPGRTLDGMVDAFYGLLSNALAHSGLVPEELNIRVEIRLQGPSFAARVSNNVAADLPAPNDIARLAKIKAVLGEADSRSKAQAEGGSGMHKLWRTINSPFYRRPELDFGFSGAGFEVFFAFELEDYADENPVS